MKRRLALLCAVLAAVSLNALAASVEAQVSTAEGKPAEDAAVVLEPLGGKLPALRQHAPAIGQKDREFIPYMTIVQAGTAVEFPNRDPFKHHVYSFSAAKVFEIKLYAGKPAKPVVFDKPGEVALGCNIHDWMEAYVLVVNTPHFAKTDAGGQAMIREVPPGRYRLHFWHPRQQADVAVREIEVRNTPVKLGQVMSIAPRVVKAKPPLDDDGY